MHIDYILTAFSPAMFGEGARADIKIIPEDQARELVGPRTKIMATRPTHERLARNVFDDPEDTVRYASLVPGVRALHLHYRGPPIPDSGHIPTGGMTTMYLIEVSEHPDLTPTR